MNQNCLFPQLSKNGAYKKGCRCDDCLENKKIKAKLYYIQNKEKIDKKVISHQKNNSEYYKEYRAKYYLLNKNTIKIKSKFYKQKNKNQRNLNHKLKMKTDPFYVLKKNIRGRIYSAIKRDSIIKDKKTLDILGCSIKELKSYLEQKFKDGMSWCNYGKGGWHIDHIIPLAHAKQDKDLFYKLCHFSNLQPLWESENCSKGSKII
jgi:hypothetical protein